LRPRFRGDGRCFRFAVPYWSCVLHGNQDENRIASPKSVPKEQCRCLVPSLKAALVPPARIFDKMTYSPWTTGELHGVLAGEGVETLTISGGETDVCVLAAALGAIDLGYRVILLKDAVCSGADDTHDASLELLGDRFSVQLEISSTQDFLSQA
jgi:nicotinamidase-related amidase